MPVQTYTTLDDPSATAGTFVQGINSSGQIVGYYHDNQGSGLHGFLLSGGTYATLDDTVAFFGTTLASGINASGQIVGYYDNSTGRHGFLYNPNGATYTPLDDPSGANGTQALGINDLGQIVGNYADSNHHPHGFLYSGGASGTYTTIDDSFAQAINASGQIVGWYSDSANHQHGFLYDGRTYTTLDVPFSIQTEALGINDRGQIVGYYLDTSVHAHGFLYSNAPTPPSTIPWVSMAPMQQASTLQGRSSGNTPTPTANTTASSRLPCRTRRRPPAPPPT